MVRHKCRSIPEVWGTPVALKDVSVSNVPHRHISFSGYDLELPWDDVDAAKGRTAGAICLTAFHSGNVLWFSTFPPTEFVDHLSRKTERTREELGKIYGKDAAASDYGFMTKMLNFTPADIRVFGPRGDASAGSALISIKAIATPSAETGIFTIRTAEGQGFQFENPQNRPRRIVDDVYGDSGGFELIFFQQAGGSAANITQPEINRVLQSVRLLIRD